MKLNEFIDNIKGWGELAPETRASLVCLVLKMDKDELEEALNRENFPEKFRESLLWEIEKSHPEFEEMIKSALSENPEGLAEKALNNANEIREWLKLSA